MTSNSLPPSGSLPSDDLETPELVQPLTVEPVVQASPVLIAVTETNAQEVDDQIIATLASLKPMDYDRLRRDQAKALDIQVKTLDEMVKAARDEHDQTAHLPFVEVEPHAEPIVPSLVLDELAEIILRYVVMDQEQADAAALWIVMTWFIDVVEVAPLAIITAPDKACGKSIFLELLGRLVCRALSSASMSASFLFRAIVVWKPTLLIDEADTFVRDSEELKGLVNAGHTRANAFVGRTVAVGDGHEPKLFNVWAAKAFAGISLEKHLPDATMSRGIVFVLRRKLPHEPVSRLRHADKDSFNTIAAKLARFAYDYSKQVRTARPVLPDDLSDRAQDNWEALFAIAECAGPDWVKRATVAALKLSSAGEESVSTGNELLADIRDVFERMGAFKQKDNFKISTVDLIAALVADEDSAWATYNRGKPLSPRQLAKQLSAYGIKPRTVRTDQKSDEKKSRTPKGYYGSEFEDAFARYLAPPEKLPPQRNDSQNVNGGGVAHDTHPKRNELAAPEALPKLDCGGVADESPVVEGGPDAGSENVF